MIHQRRKKTSPNLSLRTHAAWLVCLALNSIITPATLAQTPEETLRLNVFSQVDIDTELTDPHVTPDGTSSVIDDAGTPTLLIDSVRLRDGGLIPSIESHDPFTLIEVSGGSVQNLINLTNTAPIPPQFGGTPTSAFADFSTYEPANLTHQPIPNLLITGGTVGSNVDEDSFAPSLAVKGNGLVRIEGGTINGTADFRAAPGTSNSPTVHMSDGQVGHFILLDDANLHMTGGTVTNNIGIAHNAQFRMDDGSVNTIDYANPIFYSTGDTRAGLIQINGGTVNSINAANFDGEPEPAFQIEINGGTINEFIQTRRSTTLTINDGTIAGAFLGRDTSTTNMFGGTIGIAIDLNESSMFNLFGGNIPTDINNNPALILRADSIVNIFGTDFNFGLGDIAATTGTLTGLLSDGSQLEVVFNRLNNSRIMLHELTSTAVPLPGAAITFFTLLGPAAIRRRRRTQSN